MRFRAVLAPLPADLPRAQRFPASRGAIEAALRASGELAGAPRSLPYDAWPRTPAGAPAEVRDWRASFADTTGLVLALVAPCPIGVDAEWSLRPRWEAARERFRTSRELDRLGSDTRDDVLALWTAKEALLKLLGVGIADLGRCALLRRAGERFELQHGGHEHAVLVRRSGAHWIACASAEPFELELHVLQEVR